MESSKDPIGVRARKLSQQILGKLNIKELNTGLLSKDGLLDALQVLYDECNSECLKNYDKNVAAFVEKHKKEIRELKLLRVNLSDFEVKNVIGRGHFGDVHVVKERQTGDIYAMKTIKKYATLDQKCAAFEEERNIMAMAHSPWLTTLQYAFQDASNLYFIMEYHPGGDLLGLLYRQGGTLPETAARFYLAELVLAINDLHSMGFVHRDIKPDNILLDRCGHLKLADFGSAARLNSDGALADRSLPVGTPEYIAPEVLQCLENKKAKKTCYGTACDYWSLGILAYELTVGNTPFTGQNTTITYSKIINHFNNLKFPPDLVLSQSYVSLVKGLLSEENTRLDYEKVIKHALFKNIDFNGLRDQVPPFVPKITSMDDISNFSDVQPKKNQPNIENFKAKTKFSGKNLPFIGFTFTHNSEGGTENSFTKNIMPSDALIQSLKKENESLQKKLMMIEDVTKEHENLEKKLEQKTRRLDAVESVRDKLETDLAATISENIALKRTITLERKDRSELEAKALELIKGAKQKWKDNERIKVNGLTMRLENQIEITEELKMENEMLKEKLKNFSQVELRHKASIENVEKMSRRSVVGLESRLEKITADAQIEVINLQTVLKNERKEKAAFEKKMGEQEVLIKALEEKLLNREKENDKLNDKLTELTNIKWELEANYGKLMGEKNKIEDEIKNMSFQLKVAEDGNKVKELEKKLASEREAADKLHTTVKELREQLKELELETSLLKKKQEGHLQTHKKELENKIEQLSRDKIQLEVELKEAQLSDNNNKIKVKTLEDLLTKLESGVKKLESTSERETVLYKQIDRLEHQLAELHETSAVDKQELSQLKSKVWHLEKDLSNAHLDIKIVERDLKDKKEENKNLSKEIEGLNMKIAENKKMHEKALLELENINENLASEVIKLQGVTKNLEDKLQNENEKCDIEKKTVVELQNTITAKENRIKSLQNTIQHLEMEKFNLNGKLVETRNDSSRYTTELQTLKQQKNDLNMELQNCKRDLDNTKLNFHALREACSLLESQVVEYEKIHENLEVKLCDEKKKVENLLGELEKAKKEIQESRKQANEEKSFRLLAENKCKKLGEEIEAYQRDLDAFKSQCSEFKSYSNNLSSELSMVEEKVSDYELSIKSYERQIENFMSENTMLKEENSNQLTHLHSLKESNYKLNQSLSVAKNKSLILGERVSELQNTLEQKANFYKERELKLTSTLQQQTKLIDYLQSKMEDGGKKKKTLSDKLFGSSKKENVPPISMVLNYRDLEVELSKEREANKILREEIMKLKSEMNFGTMTEKVKQEAKIHLQEQKDLLDQIVQSPSAQKNDLFRQNSLQRMHHNIPHKFDTRVCTKILRCEHCGTQILLGRNISVCKECRINVHPICIPLVPRTCGLPQGLVKHFSDSLTKLSKSVSTEMVRLTKGENVHVEGWVKIPVRGNTGWDKYYAVLSSSVISLFQDKPSNPNLQPVERFELLPKEGSGRLILEPASSEVMVPIASSDLPFVIKIEVTPNTTCWPPKCLILMTLSVDDKEKWSKALQDIFVGTEKYKGEVVYILKDDLEINAVVDLSNGAKLLATEQGLFSVTNNHLLHIQGPTSVHYICLIPTVHQALMIVDSNRTLISCDLNHLISLTHCAEVTKPTLKYQHIQMNGLDGFHILQVSDFVKTRMACTATPKQLILLKYDFSQKEFVVVRALDTAEPTSCIHFTDQSVIIGANKFFEVDLHNYSADEFLDISDVKLSHAIKCYKLMSFPLAILLINKNPIEYLVCFHEMATFVDEFGRSSRNADITWSHIPLAFHFQSPYLYVVHFSTVDVIKIIPETYTNVHPDGMPSSFATYKLDLSSTRYLGGAKKGMYIKDKNEIKVVDGSVLDCDHISMMSDMANSETTENGRESDQFSFTSSMVQSLDGNLSDTEDSEAPLPERHKKVTFGQVTDL